MRRFLSFNDFFREYFKGKAVKLSLDGGFTCPNRDGKISNKACLFCSDAGSGDFLNGNLTIDEQIEKQKLFLKSKWKAKNYIAYFQNFTNTYGDFSYIKNLYTYISSRDDIVGISIATRLDCIDENIIELLKQISQKKLLWLELGLQSTKESTISLINRGYTHKEFDKNLQILKKNNIKFLLHLIYGLPNDSIEDMKETFTYANSQGPFGIKFHNLYIQTNSPLYKYYLENPFKLISKDEYIDLIIYSLENLNKYTVVHRITGDADKKFFYEPKWSADKLSIISKIDKILKEKNIPIITNEDIIKACNYWR
ncbi:TIGR01212 family radical SAM protein [Peptoniphilus lacrimalis]|uniref:TIGR01212 family radical SAM protein n=1 Tax=Peptoniphilus lacrimalis TaxID=33031 RepID=UPI0023F716F1|nr:TIGR01212 family radical SAM protein [Peptoniphilus lacrimalis]